MNREEKIMKRVKEHYEEALSLGKEVVAVFLQGSQNYNLDEYSEEYQSDIDTKCIILPTLDDIVVGKSPYSSTHVCANNEHIDIKDIRIMFEMFSKQNNAYIELLFTKYYYINPKYEKLVMELKQLAESISRMHFNQALRCLAGTSAEKVKALEHPYPTAMEKINKYGYDPKQLHHILRINDFMKKYIAGKSYSECLIPDNVEYLMQVKKGFYSLMEARKLALEIDLENKKLKEDHLQILEFIDQETFKALDDLKVKFIRQFLKEELLNSEN
mgnify:CR=1 FL=1